MNYDEYLKYTQKTRLECGAINIQNTLYMLGIKIPPLGEIKRKGGIIHYCNREIIGIRPSMYIKTLLYYIKDQGLTVQYKKRASMKNIKQSLKNNKHISCLMLVESNKNPVNKQYHGLKKNIERGFHYETILAIEEDNIILANPFGYIEKCTQNDFIKRWSLDNTLLGWRDRVLKMIGLVAPRTLFIVHDQGNI